MLQAKLWIENGERCLETSFKLPQPYIVYDASRVFEKYFLKLFTIVSVITSDQKHITVNFLSILYLNKQILHILNKKIFIINKYEPYLKYFKQLTFQKICLSYTCLKILMAWLKKLRKTLLKYVYNT